MLNVLLNAELPLQITAEDPLYGLRSVFLEYRTQLDQPPQQLLLQDAAFAVQTVLAPLAGTAAAGAAPRLRPTHLEFRRLLALASLRRPDGGSLRVGDVVTLQACAMIGTTFRPLRNQAAAPPSRFASSTAMNST